MHKTVALIMAAGEGRRFGGGSFKQFLPLLGRPMIAWSIERFAGSGRIDAITVVAPPKGRDELERVVASHNLRKVTGVVAGGETRQDSVWLGLQSLDSDCQRVLIHDAVRPCLSQALLERVLDALEECPAVIPAVPVVDTLVREEGVQMDAILDRAHISGVQTPQGFHTELLVKAHRRAAARNYRSSDDGSLVFALGESVRTVPGERWNIKITFESDMKVAEAILASQGPG